MFEKNIFPDDISPDKAKRMETDPDDKEQNGNAYELVQKIRKDILEKILEGKSPEEKETIIKAMIINLQEDLEDILKVGEKERKVA